MLSFAERRVIIPEFSQAPLEALIKFEKKYLSLKKLLNEPFIEIKKLSADIDESIKIFKKYDWPEEFYVAHIKRIEKINEDFFKLNLDANQLKESLSEPLDKIRKIKRSENSKMELIFEEKKEIKGETEQKSNKTPTQTINLICDLAKARNKDALIKLLNSGICIDIFDGRETATQRMAAEKDVNTLEFLIQEFDAGVHYAMRGAAMAGDFSLMGNLHVRGAFFDVAVEGAAYGGHLSLVEYLLKSTKDSHKRKNFLNKAVEGALSSGRLELVLSICTQDNVIEESISLIDKLKACNVSLDAAVRGAALNGNGELVEELLANGASIDAAVAGAIFGGHFIFSRKDNQFLLCQKMLIRPDEFSIYDAVYIAAYVGHNFLVEELPTTSNFSKMKKAVIGAAHGGHCLLVKNLLARGARFNDAASGAAKGLHFRLIEKILFDKKYSIFIIRTVLEQAAKEEYFPNKELTLRFLASIQDSQLRNQFVEVSRRYTFDMYELIQEANQLAEWKHSKNISVDQGLAWQQQPEIQGLFAWTLFERWLPKDLSFIIGTYLSASLTSTSRASSLYDAMHLDMRKNDLNVNLQQCYLSSSWFFLFRDERPNHLNLRCQSANSEVEFEQIIEAEIEGEVEDSSSYSTLIRKYKGKCV